MKVPATDLVCNEGRGEDLWAGSAGEAHALPSSWGLLQKMSVLLKGS